MSSGTAALLGSITTALLALIGNALRSAQAKVGDRERRLLDRESAAWKMTEARIDDLEKEIEALRKVVADSKQERDEALKRAVHAEGVVEELRRENADLRARITVLEKIVE